jgi:hypothetical protein
VAGWQTVAIRSNRQLRVSPPSSAHIRCNPSITCGWSLHSASTPRHRPECASAPTSNNAFDPHPHAAGGSGSSSQSNWVSSPGGCSITATGRPLAGRQGLARRAQPTRPQLPGERRIGAVVAQLHNFVEQGGGPQVRVLDQALAAVPGEYIERIRLAAPTSPGDAIAVQVGADGLAVMTEMPGDRGDRPAPAVERVRVHIVLPCEHEQRRSLHGLRVVRDQQLRRDLHRLGGATRVGKFSEQVRGDSPERRQLCSARALRRGRCSLVDVDGPEARWRPAGRDSIETISARIERRPERCDTAIRLPGGGADEAFARRCGPISTGAAVRATEQLGPVTSDHAADVVRSDLRRPCAPTDLSLRSMPLVSGKVRMTKPDSRPRMMPYQMNVLVMSRLAKYVCR